MIRVRWVWVGLFVCAMLAVWKVRARATRPKGPSDPPELKPYVELIPGSDVKFEMLPIPGGTFKMGSPPGELGRSDDEGPQHPVTVHPFWMGKAEVTWDEYDIFAFSQDIYKKQELGVNLATQPDNEKAADALTRPTPPYTDETFGFGRKGHPAINITHHAAVEYCRWLSAKTGKTYRLPTEAEWEYACRAGTETTYFFGDNSAGVGDYAWYMENSGARPHAGGQKKPSPWGLYDILGNLAEWCLDRYDKDFYGTFKPNVPTLLPVLLPGKEKFPHVARGGSWDDKPPRLRSAARRASNEDWIIEDPQRPQSIWWLTDALFVGFRIVRPLEEQDNLKGFRSQVTKYD